jgi:hypothetical protein
VDEREILDAWHDLFRGKRPTPETLATAEFLLNDISGESPIRFRLATELEELKTGAPKQMKRRTSSRRAT